MGPNEAQLRAALHEGEGESPDATALISHALDVRQRHRRRMNSIIGAAAAVAVVGVGTTALVALGRGEEHGSSSNAGGGVNAPAQPAGGAAAGSSAPNEQSQTGAGANSAGAAAKQQIATATGRRAAELTCPTTPVRYALPGGGGLGQFGSDDPLFASPVAALRLCVYALTTDKTPRTTVLERSDASRFAASLESAPSTRSGSGCAPNANYTAGKVEILAVDAKGRALKPVVITLECTSSQATNGTAVRFVTDLPDPILSLLTRIESPNKTLQNVPSGQVNGSPVR